MLMTLVPSTLSLAQTTPYPLIIGAVLALFAVSLVLTLKKFIMICEPNQVLVLSGRERAMPDGSTVGYRVIRGGRAFRIPIIEKASTLDLNTMPIELKVTNAYSRGGIPLSVNAIANVKINGDEPLLGNAIERFLEAAPKHIAAIAKETLEGNLRGVLATLTPEEVNEDRLKFAGNLIGEAGEDMERLGLQLDTLKIQNVSDDSGYLDSIGRRKTANVLKEARVAEAQRSAEASEAEASARRAAEIAKVQADQLIIEEQNKLRVRTAELDAVALAKEAEAKVAGEKAKVRAQQELEQERIETEKKRLEADIVQPAIAAKEAKELQARGEAANILEDGKARLEVLGQMIQAYASAGSDAERIFMLNMLPDIIGKMADTVQNLEIDKISVIDGGGSRGEGGLPGLLSQLPGSVIKMTEQIENATGVNILSLFQKSPTVAKESNPTEAHAMGNRVATLLAPKPAPKKANPKKSTQDNGQDDS